jgi:hypothetical protein
MTSASRKFALSTLHRTRNPLLTGEICGIAKHTVDVLLRFEYARLSRRFSAWKMAIIHTMACINKITAMHKYKLTEAELHLVVTMHSQNIRASRKIAQAEAEKVMLAAAVTPNTESVAYEFSSGGGAVRVSGGLGGSVGKGSDGHHGVALPRQVADGVGY